MNQTERDRVLMRVDIGINGNGGKGLNSRMDDIEDWAKSRPQECPGKKPSRAIILAQRAVEVGTLALIWTVADSIGKAKGWW